MEGYRILIVEDHVQSRTTMAEYLRAGKRASRWYGRPETAQKPSNC